MKRCPHCKKMFQKKGLGNHKIHCPLRPLASAALRTPPLTGVRGALRVVTDTGAGAPATKAASVAQLEAMLERVLERGAPRSAQLAERKPQDVAQQEAQQEWARLFREERARNEQARLLASQQTSQQAFDERTKASERAHEITLKLTLETSKNMLEALKATADSHARHGPDRQRKKKKKKKTKSKKQKQERRAHAHKSSSSDSSSESSSVSY